MCERVVHCGCVGVLSASPVNRAHRDADYRGISSAVQPRRQRTQKLFLCLSRFPLFCLPFLFFFFPSAHYSWRSHCVYIGKMSPINAHILLPMHIMVYEQLYICTQYCIDSLKMYAQYNMRLNMGIYAVCKHTHVHWIVCVHFNQILYEGEVIMSHTLALWLSTSNKKEKSHAESECQLWPNAKRRKYLHRHSRLKKYSLASMSNNDKCHIYNMKQAFSKRFGPHSYTFVNASTKNIFKWSYQWNVSVSSLKTAATSSPIDKCIEKRCQYIPRNCNTATK